MYKSVVTHTANENMYIGEPISTSRFFFFFLLNCIVSEKCGIRTDGNMCTVLKTHQNSTFPINIYELETHTAEMVDYSESDVCFCTDHINIIKMKSKTLSSAKPRIEMYLRECDCFPIFINSQTFYA